MSIVNIFLDDQRALIGFDTEGETTEGAHVETIKTVTLPHLNAVIAFRGYSFRLAMFVGQLFLYYRDFDALIGGDMRLMVDAAMRNVNAAIKAQGGIDPKSNMAEEDRSAEFYLIGYSKMQRRVLARRYIFTVASERLDEASISSRVIAPFWTNEDVWKLGITDDDEGMRILAQSQVNMLGERARGGSPGGGRLFITELRRDYIGTRFVCDLSSRAQGA